MKDRRGENLAINKIIILILVVLVIVVVILFVTKLGILDWIRNLPDQGDPKGDDRIQDDSHLAALGYGVVGKVTVEKREWAGGVRNYITINGEEGLLYITDDFRDGELMLSIKNDFDEVVGDIKSYKVIFDVDEVAKLVLNSPSNESLEMLNGAEYFSGTLWKKVS